MRGAEGEAKNVPRAIRFLMNCIRLRSISLSLWLDQYENHKPKFD